MTSQEVADAFQGLFDAAHAYVDSLPDGPEKLRANRLLRVFHGAGEAFADHLAERGVIRPLDGTSKPPPGP